MGDGVTASFTVNWDYVDSKLPTGQDRGSRDARLVLFEHWLKKGKKTLSLQDIDKGLKELLVDFEGNSLVPAVKELEKAIKCAFKAARNLAPPRRARKTKASKAKVDKTEFHAFLVAFRQYLELADIFEYLDDKNEDDQKLSYRECLKGLKVLDRWKIDQEDLKKKFEGVDVWVSKMRFEDFADWCIVERWNGLDLKLDDSDNEEVIIARTTSDIKKEAGGIESNSFQGAEELERIKKVFEDFDEDNSGAIGEVELMAALKSLDLTTGLTDTQLNALFAAADANADGLVDYDEFCNWLFKDY